MAQYFVNTHAQSNGDHEVHAATCIYLVLTRSPLALGEHASCHSAVAQAKRTYATANGCYFCSNACHTS